MRSILGSSARRWLANGMVLALAASLATEARGQAFPLQIKHLTTAHDQESATSQPAEFVQVGTLTYFVAEDGVNGRELWKTDGTGQGTVLVRDIRPGPGPSDPHGLIALGDTLIFAANDGAHGIELWRSNGTAGGTMMIADLVAGQGESADPRGFMVVGGLLVFQLANSNGSPMYWRTDGTTAGTFQLAPTGACCRSDGSCVLRTFDACAAEAGIAGEALSTCGPAVCDQPLAFVCCTPDGLCRYLGAVECAAASGDLLPVGATCAPRSCPPPPTVVPCCLPDRTCSLSTGSACAAAGGKTRGAHTACTPTLCTCAPLPCTPTYRRCCLTDGTCVLAGDAATCTGIGGTVAGTNVGCEPNPCSEFLIACCLADGTCARMRLSECLASGRPAGYAGPNPCFTAACADPASPSTISLGTPVGVIGGRLVSLLAADGKIDLFGWEPATDAFEKIAEINGVLPPGRSSFVVGDVILLVIDDGVHGAEWWRTDGSAEGTRMVVDANPGPADHAPTGTNTAAPIAANGLLYYFAADSHGVQLWSTDGSAAGTRRLTDLPFTGPSVGPIMPIGQDAVLFFAYDTSAPGGNKLYRVDGASPTGCARIGTTVFANPINDRAFGGGRAFFTSGNLGLWTSDGTDQGTVALLDHVGQFSFVPTSLAYIPSIDRLLMNGGEPWISDGTTAGTHELRDVSGGVFIRPIKPLGGDGLLLTISEPDTGLELHASDGTEAGTHLLLDINPGAASSNPDNLTPVERQTGGRLVYFTADSPGLSHVLWVTDGTPEGTHIVGNPDFAALREGVAASPAYRVGDVIYCRGGISGTGLELFRTDGTPEGTHLVKDIVAGPMGGFTQAPFDAAATAGGVLCFRCDLGLFRTDGTEAGTFLLKAFDPPTDLGSVANPIAFRGLVYFTASRKLWRTDGSVAGTWAVDPAMTMVFPPGGFAVVGDRLFFSESDGTGPSGHGVELWSATGDPGGTSRVVDLNPGPADSSPGPFREFAGRAVFFATGPTGRRLYRSDGTPEGTVPLLDQAAFPYAPSDFFVWNDKLLIVASNRLWVMSAIDQAPVELMSGISGFTEQTAVGDELCFVRRFDSTTSVWVTDGTPAGTREAVSAVEYGTFDYAPSALTALGDELFFLADGDRGREWYHTDLQGTSASLALDLLPGAAATNIQRLGVFGDEVVFVGGESVGGQFLYRFGLASGLHQIGVGPRVVSPVAAGNLTAAGSKLYFTEWESSSCCAPRSLYETDGTEPGTRLVADFSPTPVSRNTFGLMPGAGLNGELYFTGWKSATGAELYRLDAENGAELVKDLVPGPGDSLPRGFAGVGSRLFYAAAPTGSAPGTEPCVTDGTPAGTRMVRQIGAVLGEGNPLGIVDLGGVAMFTAYDRDHGRELWRSDGTEEGTVLVKDIMPGPGPSNITTLVVMGDAVYFGADDGEHGAELWRSDGTEAGTVLVRDVWVGPGGSEPSWLTVTGDRLHFVAYTPETGPELWITDGTGAGTFMLFELEPGPSGANINQLTVSGNRLYFLATVLPDGTSLWTYDWPGALLAFCPADYARDGSVSVGDIFAFLQDWFGGASRADFNGNGVHSVQDIFDFLAAYFSGCG